jgi:phosphatidylserine/phosphatidylglycerophosphate/cardiolipin synthase-like enzyme
MQTNSPNHLGTLALAGVIALCCGHQNLGYAMDSASEQKRAIDKNEEPGNSENQLSIIGSLEFVESVPEETTLDLPDFPEAFQVWPEVFAGAETSIDVASFYFSRMGDGEDAEVNDGIVDHLLPSLEGLTRAAGGGVDVRVLGDAKFLKTYPEALAEMHSISGIESRVIDMTEPWGGVMHAKYFVVDEKALYIGSQNWDWRAMTQIREVGVLVKHPDLASDLKRIFDQDWSIAGGQYPDQANKLDFAEPLPFADHDHAHLEAPNGEKVEAVLAASPKTGLPAAISWDLPLLVEMINSAKETLNLQLLSYNVSDREGTYFADLDLALRAAAARRVKVSILLSNWSKVHYKLHWIQSLAAVHNITVKFSNIPDHSKGFIPFARVEHAKFMTADAEMAWVGTSNWSRDYFYNSRNISLFLRGGGAVLPLETYFSKGWNSPYAETVDPAGTYEPPKRN